AGNSFPRVLVYSAILQWSAQSGHARRRLCRGRLVGARGWLRFWGDYRAFYEKSRHTSTYRSCVLVIGALVLAKRRPLRTHCRRGASAVLPCALARYFHCQGFHSCLG